MDASRFDTLAKRLAAPTTRRATLGAAAASGLLSALGFSRTAPAVRAAQGGTCVVAFAAQVLQGPSIQQTLMPNGARAGEVRGDLSFSLSATGNLENATLTLADGTTLPVVGQATGHALQVRIELAPRTALVAVGVGEQEIARCRGAIDGVATGPEVGDLGDWHAGALQQSNRGTDQSASTGGNASGNRADRTGRGGSSGGGSRGSQSGGAGSAPPSRTQPAPGEACPAGRTRCGDDCVDTATDPDHCGECDAACADAVGCRGSRCTCEGGVTLCNGRCIDTATDPLHCGRCLNGCTDGEACRDGVCQRADCPPGQTYCGAGDGCRDLASDLSHCGRCQLSCAGGICADGVCGPAGSMCPAGQEDCGEGCDDLSSNDFHCGACGNGCDDGQVCQGGVCTGGTARCTLGLTDCGGVCVDLSSSNVHCGACGVNCAANEQVCQGGFCTGDPVCPGAEEALCGVVCANLQTDPTHCGVCGNACAAGQGCQGGACTSVAPNCAAGLTDCGGVCVDLQSNTANCGFCGNACAPGATCSEGGCTDDFPCTGGKKLCSLACVDVLTDPTNCGACGNVCENSACQGGVCSAIVDQPDNLRVSCVAAGLSTCNGVCIDLESDALNCGVCGLECAYGEICSAGACQSSCAAGLSYCNGVCVDTASDPYNCGFCGNGCDGFSQCVSGGCISTAEELPSTVLSCAAKGLTDCGGVCVDLLNDDNNCGACGHACYPGTCNNYNGTCSICDPGNDPVTGRSNCA